MFLIFNGYSLVGILPPPPAANTPCLSPLPLSTCQTRKMCHLWHIFHVWQLFFGNIFSPLPPPIAWKMRLHGAFFMFSTYNPLFLVPPLPQPPPTLPHATTTQAAQPKLPTPVDNKNASMWTCFCCLQAFLSSKIRNMPSLAPLPFPSCRHQKCVHVDMFLVSACSLPLKKQKPAHKGMFLIFAGSVMGPRVWSASSPA